MLAWILGKPLTLLFDPFESIVLFLAGMCPHIASQRLLLIRMMIVLVVNYTVQDGKSNWLEGMILMCLYVIIAVTFWYYPGSCFFILCALILSLIRTCDHRHQHLTADCWTRVDLLVIIIRPFCIEDRYLGSLSVPNISPCGRLCVSAGPRSIRSPSSPIYLPWLHVLAITSLPIKLSASASVSHSSTLFTLAFGSRS